MKLLKLTLIFALALAAAQPAYSQSWLKKIGNVIEHVDDDLKKNGIDLIPKTASGYKLVIKDAYRYGDDVAVEFTLTNSSGKAADNAFFIHSESTPKSVDHYKCKAKYRKKRYECYVTDINNVEIGKFSNFKIPAGITQTGVMLVKNVPEEATSLDEVRVGGSIKNNESGFFSGEVNTIRIRPLTNSDNSHVVFTYPDVQVSLKQVKNKNGFFTIEFLLENTSEKEIAIWCSQGTAIGADGNQYDYTGNLGFANLNVYTDEPLRPEAPKKMKISFNGLPENLTSMALINIPFRINNSVFNFTIKNMEIPEEE